MRLRGVNYDVGRVLDGMNWRPAFDPLEAHRELEIIRDDLHCNAVRICGEDIARLTRSPRTRSAWGWTSGSPPNCGTTTCRRRSTTSPRRHGKPRASARNGRAGSRSASAAS
jgi:hypothetical protein